MIENKENVCRQPKSPLLPAYTPSNNKTEEDQKLGSTVKFIGGKMLWEAGLTQKVTPKSESPHQESRKFHKLSQKVLPFAAVDTEIDCSITTNSTIGDILLSNNNQQQHVQLANLAAAPSASSKKSEEKVVTAGNTITRSKSEDKKEANIGIKVMLQLWCVTCD